MDIKPEDSANVEAVKIEPRIYSLDQERRIIRELYSKVYRTLTGELDEEGNIPFLELEGSNPWGQFELQVMSLLLKKPRSECYGDLIDMKKYCIRVGSNFMTAVKTKRLIGYIEAIQTHKARQAPKNSKPEETH